MRESVYARTELAHLIEFIKQSSRDSYGRFLNSVTYFCLQISRVAGRLCGLDAAHAASLNNMICSGEGGGAMENTPIIHLHFI